MAGIAESLVAVERMHTNIVNCSADSFASDAAEINRALARAGVLANSKRTKIRFVTHYHIDEAAVDAAIDRFADVVQPFRQAA